MNLFALAIGPPGHGKTSLAASLARERLSAGRWVLVHDQEHEFDKLCTRYETPAAFRQALAAAARGKQLLPAGAAFPCPAGADELLELAVELGETWNRGDKGTVEPILLVINESSSFTQSGSTFLSRLHNVAVNQRRHLGLEILYCLQRPSMLPRSVYDVLTDAFLFYQPSAERVRQLEQLLGLDRGELDELLTLPPHRFMHWRPRRGDGSGGLV